MTTKITSWIDKYNLSLEELTRALCHPSHTESLRAGSASVFQRDEFLGDAVLGLAVAHTLTKMYPDADEGTLTVQRSQFVKKSSLAKWARKNGLDQLITFGGGHDDDILAKNNSICSDAQEVFLAFVYKSRGFEAALEIVQDWLSDPEMDQKRVTAHPKTLAKQWAEKHGQPYEFKILNQQGPDHNREFTVAFAYEGDVYLGKGRSIREAETRSAEVFLAKVCRSEPA